eukprot:jgi/Hompol1/1774/HPOL_005714-RA
MVPCLRNGTVIFVESPYIEQFLTKMLPIISTTFVLITGDSDYSMPGTLSRDLVQLALDSPLILHWMLCIFDPLIKTRDFHRIISQSKFVVSPQGWGLDCYRTYEALYLGSYPIIKSSSLNEIFEDLPVVIVPSLTDLNEDELEVVYKQYRQKAGQFKMEKLYGHYWVERIGRMRGIDNGVERRYVYGVV